jgi:hypothetical protein
MIAGPLQIKPITVPVHYGAGLAAPGFGQVVSEALDVNDDDTPDFLVGWPGQDLVYLCAGPHKNDLMRLQPNANGLSIYRSLAEQLPLVMYVGRPGEEFGAALAGLGKGTKDIFNDIAIGAPGFDVGGALDVGRVIVTYGNNRGWFYPGIIMYADYMYVRITGQDAGDRFGSAVTSADLHNDDYNDIIVGAPGAGGGRGKVYVFWHNDLGYTDVSAHNARAVIMGENPGDNLGAVVRGIGDVNGDGYEDIALGAPGYDGGGLTDSGAVYIFYGGQRILTAAGGYLDLASGIADVTILGTVNNGRFGQAITAGGDLGGNIWDLCKDFAVTGGNTVYVFFGGPYSTPSIPYYGGVIYRDTDTLIKISMPGVNFGQGLALAGDLDSNYYDDLVIGAPGANAGQGGAYLFYGQFTGNSGFNDPTGMTKWQFLSAPAGGQFGAAVAGVGDVLEDTYADMVIAAPGTGEVFFIY